MGKAKTLGAVPLLLAMVCLQAQADGNWVRLFQTLNIKMTRGFDVLFEEYHRQLKVAKQGESSVGAGVVEMRTSPRRATELQALMNSARLEPRAVILPHIVFEGRNISRDESSLVMELPRVVQDEIDHRADELGSDDILMKQLRLQGDSWDQSLHLLSPRLRLMHDLYAEYRSLIQQRSKITLPELQLDELRRALEGGSSRLSRENEGRLNASDRWIDDYLTYRNQNPRFHGEPETNLFSEYLNVKAFDGKLPPYQAFLRAMNRLVSEYHLDLRAPNPFLDRATYEMLTNSKGAVACDYRRLLAPDDNRGFSFQGR